MALTVSYTNFGGRIVSEKRSGTVRNYVRDTLGSTAALLDSTGTVTDTFTYWPYGEERTRTGSTATPFTFVGTLGYFKDASSRLYVRLRHMKSNLGQWASVDPVWPAQKPYAYVDCRAVQSVDPLGLCGITGCNPASNNCVISSCFGCTTQECQNNCDFLATMYYLACHKPLSVRPPGHWRPKPGVGVAPPPLPPFPSPLPLPGSGGGSGGGGGGGSTICKPDGGCSIGGPGDCANCFGGQGWNACYS
jgi:RHS repeat-associated protein